MTLSLERGIPIELLEVDWLLYHRLVLRELKFPWVVEPLLVEAKPPSMVFLHQLSPLIFPQ